ncbi:phage NrS-1 polymerase family protein [Haloarchaeobius baliensis]|uniref:phage NrS-1 polymerase family protein n=1 Tax=Haloarchaeobius baliensis TaxID=1670458 RepID=UPI003F885DF4
MTVDPDTIPTALREYPQWVCWRAKERDGKMTKIPIDPQTGSFASVSDPDTWTIYEVALGASESEDGLGFVFTEDDPFVGVDLDDCREDGELTDWAVDIVERLDSYTEVSPSGTGVHVLIEGMIPSTKSRSGSFECYDSARFFTMTGDHVGGTPAGIEERQDAFAPVYDQYVYGDDESSTEERAKKRGTVSTPTSLSDAELIEKARNAKNGVKFESLWNGSTAGYESQSEADMALCCLLAFWTGNDEARMDRLFRESGLYREKWDEVHYADGSSYGEQTVANAVKLSSGAQYEEASEPGLAGESGCKYQMNISIRDEMIIRERVALLERRLKGLERELASTRDELANLQRTCHDAVDGGHEADVRPAEFLSAACVPSIFQWLRQVF